MAGCETTSAEDWDATLAVNLRGPFLIAKHAIAGSPRAGPSCSSGLWPASNPEVDFRLRRLEGGADRAVPARGARGGRPRDPRQRGRSGPDRHAARARRHRGPPVTGEDAGAARSPRHAVGGGGRRPCSCSRPTRRTSRATRSPSTAACRSSERRPRLSSSAAVVHPGVLHAEHRGVLGLLEAAVHDLTDEEGVVPGIDRLTDRTIHLGNSVGQYRAPLVPSRNPNPFMVIVSRSTSTGL